MDVWHHPKVAIIILNWNGLQDTMACLTSLQKITYPNCEVVVVDNASEGDDVRILRNAFGNNAQIVENDRNYGYAGGNNIGIKHCLTHSSPDYLLLLNNDTVLAPDFLVEMLKVAESDECIGIVGPKVYYYDFPLLIQSAGAQVNMWTGRASLIGASQQDTGQYDRQREVDYLLGCCLLVRTAVVRTIGLFDEAYFCYWDETDYCVRARKAGYKLAYAPKAEIWHKWPLISKPWNKTPRRKETDTVTYYMAKNSFRFMRKHATRAQYCSFLLHFFTWRFWCMNGVSLLCYRDIEQVIAFCRGVKHGLTGST
jgi:GT2 family glycosyltransferase